MAYRCGYAWTKVGEPCKLPVSKKGGRCKEHNAAALKKIADDKALFLQELLAAGGTVRVACRNAGLPRATMYHHKRHDDAFAEEWDEICEESTDRIEECFYTRCVDGWDEPVYQGGELVGVKRKFDHTVGMFLLKARRPHLYRERVDVSHGLQADAEQQNLLKRVMADASGYAAMVAALGEVEQQYGGEDDGGDWAST